MIPLPLNFLILGNLWQTMFAINDIWVDETMTYIIYSLFYHSWWAIDMRTTYECFKWCKIVFPSFIWNYAAFSLFWTKNSCMTYNKCTKYISLTLCVVSCTFSKLMYRLSQLSVQMSVLLSWQFTKSLIQNEFGKRKFQD